MKREAGFDVSGVVVLPKGQTWAPFLTKKKKRKKKKKEKKKKKGGNEL